MYSVVTSKDRYYKNMPVVGMTGLNQFYTIPGLNNMMQPRVDYQFYNPYTGSLGPTVTNANNIGLNNYGLNNYGLNNLNTANIKSNIYERNGILVALVGTQSDIDKAENCLDKHLSTPAVPVVPAAPAAPTAPDLMFAKTHIETQLKNGLKKTKLDEIKAIINDTKKTDDDKAKEITALLVGLL